MRLIVLGSMLLLAGCIDGTCDRVAGQEYEIGKVRHLAAGAPADEVVSSVGEPLSRTRVGQHEEDWRYYIRCERKSWVGVGGMKVRSGGAVMHSEAIVRMRDGRVERIVKDDPWVFE